jgi:glycosyltransferase involved in cell wall biosynthesis
MEPGTSLSIVIPAYNEEENLPELMKEIRMTFANREKPSEVILVNDGSTDHTLEIMLQLKDEYTDFPIRVLTLDRNYGLSAALDAGFQNTKGDSIVSLDSDLQNDPADIPKLVEKLKEYDVVIGIRRRRQDSFVKKSSSKIANGIRDLALNESWKDTGCTLKAYRRSFLDRLKLFDGLHRFLPTLLKMEGARILEMEVNHRHRIHGKSKYHLWNRLIGPLRDLMAVRWMKRRHFRYHVEEK